MKINLIFLFLLSSTTFAVFSQPYNISGRIFDAQTGQPLAFVNIVINQSNIGGVSDIDGHFKLLANEPIRLLRFTFVGYAEQLYQVTEPETKPVILLERSAVDLPEVTIFAGTNPAHRIIENAIRNRDHNNYERLPSFSYTSYDKMIFTVNTDTIMDHDTVHSDASFLRLKEYIGKHHLFIMETVAQRHFLYPNRDRQKVTASRISGFNDPIITFLISQIQSTSFYDEHISISSKKYVNPISRGSITRYSYIIEDTLFIAGSPDTTFIISYKPKPNTNFEGLKGLLYINSKGWAIQNVIAEPERQEDGIAFKIQQMYELIDGSYWFPVQINTDIILKNININGFHPIGQGKSYINDIVVNPQLVRLKFNEVNLEVDPDAGFISENEWKNLRAVELTEKDLRTYQVLDSIGEERNFDHYALMAETLMGGNILLGSFNIPLHKMLRYNLHEKIYLGLGLTTNKRISRILNAGIYAGYGFGDKQFKYGGMVQLNFHRTHDAKWFFRLSNDLKAAGEIDPFKDESSFELSNYLSLADPRMDHVKAISTGLQYRILNYLVANISLERTWKSPHYEYQYSTGNELSFPKAYIFTELSAGFRFAWHEAILQTSRSRISFGSDYPVIWFRFARGLDGFIDGQFSFRRYDLKIEHSFYTKFLGETALLLRGGIIDGEVPYMQLFSRYGNYSLLNIYASGNFTTMRVNEFVADHYANIYLTHDFGKLLFRTKRFEPEFVIASHAGFGWLLNQKQEDHSLILESFEKGYFESGLMINNLLDLQIFNLGVSAFYRYGPYSRKQFKGNISALATINFPL
jgi:hypothetical protein